METKECSTEDLTCEGDNTDTSSVNTISPVSSGMPSPGRNIPDLTSLRNIPEVDINRAKFDVVMTWILKPKCLLYVVPIPLWVVWAMVTHDFVWFFPMSVAITIFVILQNNPYIIKSMYSKPYYFNSFRIKRKMRSTDDQMVVEMRYRQCFKLIAMLVISISSFCFIYFKFFDFYHLPYSYAQIFGILSGALLGINSIQNFICRMVLSMLVYKQKSHLTKVIRSRASIDNSLSDIQIV